MKDILAGIVSMLETGSPEQQVAAAQVLAWLKPKTPAAVKALGTLVDTGGSFLKPYVVEALAAIGNNASLSALIPLLHFEGPLRSKAVRVFAQLGSQAEGLLVKEYEKAAVETREVIIDILALTRGEEAVKFFLAQIKDESHAQLQEVAAKSLHRELVQLHELSNSDEAAAEELTAIRKKLLATVNRLSKKAGPETRAWFLRLLSAVKDESCKNAFLKYADSKEPAEARAEAIRGLMGLNLSSNDARKLLGYLKEDDFLHVVGPALDVLENCEFSGAQMATALQKLLESPRPEVRQFAIRSLAAFPTDAVAKLLLPFLESFDERVRQVTSESLAANPHAAVGLVKMLLAARDLAEAQRPHAALLELAAGLSAVWVKKLVARYIELIDAQDPVSDLYREVLSHSDLHHAGPPLLAEARARRESERYGDSLRILQTVPRAGEQDVDAETRFEFALTTLVMRTEVPEFVDGDPVIGHFCRLLAAGFPLLDRLKNEGLLRGEQYLYLGTRFTDRIAAEREFGVELLKWLIERDAESKEAVQALQKLRIEGLA